MNSLVLSANRVSLVVDPGYFPRELDELVNLVRDRGAACAIVFTHGHWDHIMGWRSFPDVEVLTAPSLYQAIIQCSAYARKNIDEAADFDRRYYVARGAPHSFPPISSLRSLEEGATIQIDKEFVRILHLPGHSPDGLGLFSQAEGLLIVGDYLSPCEIPFVDDLQAYRATLRRFIELLPEVKCVWPGHGHALTAHEARRIATADLCYLDALDDCAARKDLDAARALALPRAADSPEMREHHLANCRAALLKS